MSEAKQKRRAHAKQLEQYPYCIYCGGTVLAEAIEYMPPIGMFRLRQRPNGLVFPACRACNNGTRISDQVASVLGRMYPDAPGEVHQTEVRRLLQGIKNNVPGLLEEMHLTDDEQQAARRRLQRAPLGVGFLRANGPIVDRHMRQFAAKLGFALHFEIHKSPIPPSGGVQSLYFTNVNAALDELPFDMLQYLPPHKTLRQGSKEVSDQFKYSMRVTEEGRHSVFYCIFNRAFATLSIAAMDRAELPHEHPIVAPGELGRLA
jgi:hypothetical protein